MGPTLALERMPPSAINRRVVLGPEPLSERAAAGGMQSGNGDGPIVAITLRRDGSAFSQDGANFASPLGRGLMATRGEHVYLSSPCR
jgi:hypothetical protein